MLTNATRTAALYLRTSRLSFNLLKDLQLKSTQLNIKSNNSSTSTTSADSSKQQTVDTNTAEQQTKQIDPAELKKLQEKLTKYETDLGDIKDKYLRSLAETENIRIRMLKQIDDAKVFGIQNFCKDLLEVADILNLAVVNTDPSKSKNDNESISADSKEKLNAMFNGLAMTEKCLLKVFEKHGLTQIRPNDGEKFDPNMHEAIFKIPLKDKTSGTVNVVTKIGYKLRDRVIRAAQVGVVQ